MGSWGLNGAGKWLDPRSSSSYSFVPSTTNSEIVHIPTVGNLEKISVSKTNFRRSRAELFPYLNVFAPEFYI